MENIDSVYQLNLDKDIKRHKSAHIPAGSEALNKIFPNHKSDLKNLEQNKNKNPNNDFFRIKSSSIFAYQEIDRFSSFCDEDEQINDEEKNFQSDGNNKDEYNNCSTAFSMEINDEGQNNANCFKRKSMIDVVPNFSQYMQFQNQVLEGSPNFDNSEGGKDVNFDEFVINHLNAENKRRNTQKLNRNYINEIFNKKIENGKEQEQINNFEKRKKSNSLVYYKGYNNYNAINPFNNNFLMNTNYQGNNIEDLKDKGEIIVGNDINNKNEIEQNDFYINTNEYNGFGRKKSNSLAVKASNMFNQCNKINFPYLNNNMFYLQNSKNNSKSHNYLNYNDLIFNKKSNLYIICQDQSNCRNIQDQLDLNKNDLNYIKNFLERIKPFLINIITQQFGNYVIQKLLEILIYQENKTLFAEVFSFLDQNNCLYSVSIDNYGTRVIQKTFEKLIITGYNKIETPALNNCLKNLISKHLFDLCQDKNGNHVYQKLIKVFKGEKEEISNFLFDYLADFALDIALLQQGATIFSTAINFGSYNQKEKLCVKIFQNLEILINNKYGNYSVQALINSLKDEKKLIEPIYSYISKNIVNLSKQKYSSNVVDTFIMKNDTFSKMIINDIIKNNQIKDMILDQFGNYVIQKAMSISDQETLNKIIEQIKPIVPELLLSNFGKKIINKLMHQYNIVFQTD